MQIFLAPISSEISYKNFLSTIKNGVNFSVVEPHLDKEGKKTLKGRGKLLVWGIKETKKSFWDKIKKGNLVLFYQGGKDAGRNGRFVYVGRLLYKQYNKKLGLSFWSLRQGEKSWACIFFLHDLRSIHIPISDIRNFAGYKPKFIIQGFTLLNQKGTRKILKKFKTVEKFLAHYS